jgi:hypothetical protein
LKVQASHDQVGLDARICVVRQRGLLGGPCFERLEAGALWFSPQSQALGGLETNQRGT